MYCRVVLSTVGSESLVELLRGSLDSSVSAQSAWKGSSLQVVKVKHGLMALTNSVPGITMMVSQTLSYRPQST